MIKAIIIDDEANIREDIHQKVEKYFASQIEVAAKVGSIKESLLAIDLHRPNLLFLDIELEDGNSFDLLSQIANKDFEIIFITGYNQHAIKAIKVGALDYLLKPIDDHEFVEAVKKAIDQTAQTEALDKAIEVSADHFKGTQKKRVILRTADTVYAVYEKDVLYCRSDGNYTTFYTIQGERIVVSKPLKKIEEILSDDAFVRCHQSYVVNKIHVTKYNKQGVLIIQPDIKVPVSSRRKDFTLTKIFK